MIVTGNPLLTGASGKIKDLVVKQYQGKTVITSKPDMSRRKLSDKQKESNERMKMANIAAHGVTENPRLLQRACEMLQLTPNKVYRAIIKQFMLIDGYGNIFEETEQEKLDKQTLNTLAATITTEIPGAELMLFGNRASGAYDAKSDWDILILTSATHSPALKWELQEKLFNITIQQGTRVNILLVPKDKWYTEPEYEMIRKRIEGQLLPVKEFLKK